MRVRIAAPFKDDIHYTFNCTINDNTPFVFGFESLNYAIEHHWVWDSFYPVVMLVCECTPFTADHGESITVEFDYPVHEYLPSFLHRLAHNRGMDVTVRAETFSRSADIQGKGSVIAFSGGKESRLLLGLVQEFGEQPTLANDDIDHVTGIECMKSRGCPKTGWLLPNRLMPGLMLQPAKWYYGGSLEYAQQHTPWHEYYDFGSLNGLVLYENYLWSMGVDMQLLTPLAPLTTPMIQRILVERYPLLRQDQQSVPVGSLTEKNLHIALCEMYAGVSFQEHCSDELFRLMLAGYVTRRLARPADMGRRDSRRLFRRVCDALIFRFKLRREFVDVYPFIPESWDHDWIDRVHYDVYPPLRNLKPDCSLVLQKPFVDVYSQYGLPSEGQRPWDLNSALL